MKRSKSQSNSSKYRIRSKFSSLSNMNEILNNQTKRTIQQLIKQIHQYIQKKKEIELINNYELYKSHIYSRCKRLQDILYGHPQYRDLYITDNNVHFMNAFQHILFENYRKGILTPSSHNNVRQEVIQNIQKWILSWLHRQCNLQSLKQREKEQQNKLQLIQISIEQYANKKIQQNLPF